MLGRVARTGLRTGMATQWGIEAVWVTHGHKRFMSGQREPEKSKTTSMLTRVAGGGALLLGSSKYVLAAAKVAKFPMLISMFASYGVYAVFFGPWYAVGIIGSLAIHEAGHMFAMVHYESMMFVPLIGAAVTASKHCKTEYEAGQVAIAGPALGAAGAICTSAFGYTLDSPLIFAVADFAFMINLMNLIPLPMLDGGAISDALSNKIMVGSVAMLTGLIVSGAPFSPLFYILYLSGVYTAGKRLYYGHEKVHPPSYYAVSRSQKVLLGAEYLFLILGIVLLQMANKALFRDSIIHGKNRSRELVEIYSREVDPEGAHEHPDAHLADMFEQDDTIQSI